MTTEGQNFTIYQGDTKEIIISITDESGSVVDLAGYAGAVFVAYNQTLDSIVVQKLLAGGIIIPTPANGQLVVTLESADTEDLVPRNYGIQCEIEDAFGNHATVMTGYMKVLRSITHSLL
jgi:hypothetical protein